VIGAVLEDVDVVLHTPGDLLAPRLVVFGIDGVLDHRFEMPNPDQDVLHARHDQIGDGSRPFVRPVYGISLPNIEEVLVGELGDVERHPRRGHQSADVFKMPRRVLPLADVPRQDGFREVRNNNNVESRLVGHRQVLELDRVVVELWRLPEVVEIRKPDVETRGFSLQRDVNHDVVVDSYLCGHSDQVFGDVVERPVWITCPDRVCDTFKTYAVLTPKTSARCFR
jgi:hypothetical protein